MPTSATPSCDAQISASVRLRLAARLLERRRQIRPRVAVAGGALRRRRFGAANPRVEPALEVAGYDERTRPGVGPEQPEERVLAFARLDRTRHPDALRLGRVVPCVPVDAEPAVAAGDGQRVEHGIRARIRGQAETAEDGRDRGVENPAGRLAPAHRLDDEEQPAQLRRKLRIDDVRARVRGGGRTRPASTRPAPWTTHVDAAEALDCRIDHGATPAPRRSCPRPGRARRRARSASEPAGAAARAARSTSQDPRSVPAHSRRLGKRASGRAGPGVRRPCRTSPRRG